MPQITPGICPSTADRRVLRATYKSLKVFSSWAAITASPDVCGCIVAIAGPVFQGELTNIDLTADTNKSAAIICAARRNIYPVTRALLFSEFVFMQIFSSDSERRTYAARIVGCRIQR